jgi:FlaA1/EpsC-like NDP-sugar epimerase
MPALQSSAGKRTLIIGAGDAGEIALRSLMKDYMGIYHVVGFLDDDPAKQKMSIHGYPILGKVADAARIVHDENITEVLIAISQAPKQFIKSIVESCTGRNVNFRIMPAIKSFMTGEVQIEKIRKVKLEDLLGREPVKLDRDAVAKQLSGKCVLVTGAGGSIGSEIARQAAGYAPNRLVLLDFAESALFEIDRAIREDYPDVDVIPCLVDIRQTEDVNAVFKELTPHRVFHAAAYKHVPLMEQHPMDAVRTNVIGTENLANAAITNNVEKFVMISTDKAVRPSSVMGATKRICELVVARRGTKSRTIFAAVRFGNVLGSNGSVIPIFEKQIAKGGPVRVTDPNMTRYFMTIPEAVELVLQASVLSTSNDVFVLDMGTPVKIIDLATNMIELSGMIVDEDIKIEIMGPRPGEKTHEELVTYGEQLLTTSIDKISLLCKEDMIPGGKDFETNLKRLKKMAIDRRRKETLKYIWDIIEADRKNANHAN